MLTVLEGNNASIFYHSWRWHNSIFIQLEQWCHITKHQWAYSGIIFCNNYRHQWVYNKCNTNNYSAGTGIKCIGNSITKYFLLQCSEWQHECNGNRWNNYLHLPLEQRCSNFINYRPCCWQLHCNYNRCQRMYHYCKQNYYATIRSIGCINNFINKCILLWII
jgi:hypothetical protein